VTHVVILGGGHNGLAAAFYLARAGLKPIVLESRATCGGGAVTTELHPGFRCPALSHHTPLWSEVASEMELARHGLEVLRPGVEAFTPNLDGPPLVLHRDPRQAAEAMRRVNSTDAQAYPEYRTAMAGIAGVLARLLQSPPPDIDRPAARDLWHLLKTARQFRALDKRSRYRLLRWGPMPVADLAREWFQSELLCASIAGPAVSGTMLGPRSAGSGLVLLLHEATRLLADGPWQPRGGPGALAQAMASAAAAAGADIRTATRADQIVVADDRVSAVIAGGRRIDADAVISAIDPKSTFLTLMDPADLAPEFLAKIRNYRAAGTLAKVNLALSGVPSFAAPSEWLSGRIQIGPHMDYLERAFDHAKYGEFSEHPWLDITVPSVLDPDLAPAGAHVMSIYAHYAPHRLRGADWSAARAPLLRSVLVTLERFAPGIAALVVAADVITPADLESEYGLYGGHVYHGELALDQIATMRPLLGHARYASPVPGLYMCGAGTHPGGFMTGASGKLAAREILRSIK
jgi:phytoene dehydrogenase-like protein